MFTDFDTQTEQAAMYLCFMELVILFAIIRTSFQFDNLAKNKHAEMSSRSNFWNKAELANDGKVSGEEMECTRTGSYKQEAWWNVDVLASNIHSIMVYYKDNGTNTMSGFSVYVSDDESNFKTGHLCYHHNTSTPPELVQEIECKVHGRYVTFYNERRTTQIYPDTYSKYAVVELCELKVFGCVRGKGGYPCRSCHENCVGSICDVNTAACLVCSDGYKGPICNQTCDPGYYGTGCGKICNIHCKDPQQCNNVDGVCTDGCQEGWQGKWCSESKLSSSSQHTEDSSMIIVGVTIACVLVIVAIIIVVLFIRYRLHSEKRKIARRKSVT